VGRVVVQAAVEDAGSKWDVVIGLEIHAQVLSESKLFSRAPANRSGARPNASAHLVDLALPGVLPVLNRHCVEQAVRAGFAFNATVHKKSAFDRKNYFYPDLPQGYQISQFYHPIVTDGEVAISNKVVRINRVHMEQDAGKSLHDVAPDCTCLDFNRAGVALLEIVTEPDISSAAEAVETIKKIQSILRYIGVCSGDMEAGALRCDANISIKPRGSSKLGTRCEIKNLNSLSSIAHAIDFEVADQARILESGQSVVQCTKLFDVDAGVARVLRSKEDPAEYRYFRDPDLPVVILPDEMLAQIKAALPELPDAKKERYEQQYGLSPYDAAVLTALRETTEYYEAALGANNDKARAKMIANWITTELFGKLRGTEIQDSPIAPERLGALVDLVISGAISGKIAKQVFELMFKDGRDPAQIVKEHGLEQVSDGLEQIIDEILAQNADKVADYRSGKSRLFDFFVGQVMKQTKGRASPGVVHDLLVRKLGGSD
jgi:aspartyl-tRNA(Asn)/glutamyl-tRNA(Gln) amidotransferase subunit B